MRMQKVIFLNWLLLFVRFVPEVVDVLVCARVGERTDRNGEISDELIIWKSAQIIRGEMRKMLDLNIHRNGRIRAAYCWRMIRKVWNLNDCEKKIAIWKGNNFFPYKPILQFN